MLVYLILGLSFGFAAAVQPGPLQMYLISRALSAGWRATLLSACAPLISDIPVVALVLLVLNIVPAWVIKTLHLVGGLFLLYLAWGAYKSFRRFIYDETALTGSKYQNLFRAVAINLLNPNPYLSWSLIMGPVLLTAWRESPPEGLGFITAFYAVMVLTNIGIIVLFASFRSFGPRVNRTLIGISAVILAGFGFYQLWLGIVGFS